MADCDELGTVGMRKCLSVPRHDRTIAAAIRRCPNKLPQVRFGSYAYKLFVSGLPRAFRAYIAGGRCSRLSEEMRNRLMCSFVDNNSVPFVRAMIRHCALDPGAWNNFIRRAELQGKNELLAVMRSGQRQQQNPPVPYQGGQGSAGYYKGTRPQSGPQLGSVLGSAAPTRDMSSQQTPMGTLITDQQPYQQASPMAGTYSGDPLYARPEDVSRNINVLAQLSPQQAGHFGLLSEGCMALTEAHLRQPGVSAEVVGSLPLECFRRIPPQAFSGLTAPMAARITWWSFVTRDQIRYVPTGEVIRAVPFDQLGRGRQRDREDREHPCWTITRDQLRSIKKSSQAYREYKRRCIRSAAAGNAASAGLMFSVAILSAYMLL